MHRRTFWSNARLGALLLWALLAAVSARAQPDSGDFQILQARYGTAERNVDVTQRLKDLARRDRSFKLGNDTFGIDPDYGRVKTLRIYTRTRDGGNRTFEYREGQMVDGAQFSAWGSGNWNNGGWNGGWGGPGGSSGGGDSGQWQIMQARYGTAQHNIDVTPRLKELARRDRQVQLTNDLFGKDPHYGAVKTLRIFARSGNQNRTFEIREGGIIDGAQFSGWSSGNWGNGGWNGGWGGSGGAPGGRVAITNAVYGAGRQTVDVTQRVREQLRDGRLDVRADNTLAGRDPAPQVAKTLRITYTVDGGRQQQREFGENTQARLP
jgi:hypothetical protein